MKQPPDEVLGVVRRSRAVEIRVVRRTFHGNELVDLRLFIAQAGGAPCPTEKGVALRLHEVAEVIEALRKAAT